MNFDDYLTEYYGFNTQDQRWMRMSKSGKSLLKESYKMDIAKLEKGTEPSPEIAALSPSSPQEV